jgi:hypothetical protein
VGYFDLDIVGWDVFGPWDVGEGQDGEGGATAGMRPGTHFDVMVPVRLRVLGEKGGGGRLWTQSQAIRPRTELGGVARVLLYTAWEGVGM